MAHLKSIVDLIHLMMETVEPQAQTLGIGAMHYGDQDKLAARNTVCFEPDVKATDLSGAMRLVNRTFRVYVLIYTAAVASTEMNREESDKLAADIEDLLNGINDADDKLLHCMVVANESGYSTKNGSIVRSARLTFEATTRDRLP